MCAKAGSLLDNWKKAVIFFSLMDAKTTERISLFSVSGKGAWQNLTEMVQEMTMN